jgi:protein SCO1/2
MNRPARPVARTAYLKMALVLLLGVAAGVALFVATLRSTPADKMVSVLSSQQLQGLVDQHSQPFDPAVLQGRYTLVYFGFTFCPDACPTALYAVSQVLLQLDPEAKRIQPVFVSVDPARDTPEKLTEYLGSFSTHLIGLTGSADVIQTVEQAFGVIAIEHRDESLPGSYTMDHSNEFLLFSTGGRLLTRLPANEPATALLESLRALTRAESI